MSIESFEENNDLDYSDLSQAFVNKPDEYAQMLKMVYEDFINSHMLIIDAVTDRNLLGFRKVHHDLRSNIILFKLDSFAHLMDNIDGSLKLLLPIDSQLINQLHNHYSLIFQSLEKKIKDLS